MKSNIVLITLGWIGGSKVGEGGSEWEKWKRRINKGKSYMIFLPLCVYAFVASINIIFSSTPVSKKKKNKIVRFNSIQFFIHSKPQITDQWGKSVNIHVLHKFTGESP